LTDRARRLNPPPSSDAFVVKLDPSGTSIVYSTLFGGTYRSFGLAIALDAAGEAYVARATARGRAGLSDGAPIEKTARFIDNIF
jgi:hypothetical protein